MIGRRAGKEKGEGKENGGKERRERGRKKWGKQEEKRKGSKKKQQKQTARRWCWAGGEHKWALIKVERHCPVGRRWHGAPALLGTTCGTSTKPPSLSGPWSKALFITRSNQARSDPSTWASPLHPGVLQGPAKAASQQRKKTQLQFP